MKSGLISVSYDFETKLGRLDVVEFGSPDLGELIEGFEAIDPDVRLIEIFADGRPDGIAKRVGSGWDHVFTR
jgi:hypothetical protein